jgi:hypothetical protein
MNHSTLVITLISTLLLFGIVSLAFADDVIYTEYIQFTYNGISIDLYIVDGKENLPSTCESIAACAYTGYSEGEQTNIIFINELYLGQKDAWGYSVLYHEIKHIICKCNWHEALRI